MKTASAALQAVMAPTEPTREEVVDEFAALDIQVELFAPTKSRHEKLRKEILSWYPDDVLAPKNPGRVEGRHSIVLIAPRQWEREVRDMLSLAKAFGGVKRLLAVCSVTIKAIEAELGEEVAQRHLVADYTGPRKLTAIPRPPAEPATAA